MIGSRYFFRDDAWKFICFVGSTRDDILGFRRDIPCSTKKSSNSNSRMATISKDSVAQFWLQAFPNSRETQKENFSFSDPKVVSNLLQFTSENNEEKKVFALIHADLEQTQVSRILKTTTTTTTTNKISPKRRLQCQINIEVLQIADDEEVEAPKTIKTSNE